MRAIGATAVTVTRLSPLADTVSELASDVRKGLRAEPKTLPAKYFYDANGSQLFENITQLAEYYLTRAEIEILRRDAFDLVTAICPTEIVELGSGYSVKTRLLIDAMHSAGCLRRYVPIDISEAALHSAARALSTDYPWLRVDGLVGDFAVDLARVPRYGTRLITFLGSTVGNFLEHERRTLLRYVASALEPGDAVLLGLDLVKDPATLLRAYDDSLGVTAAFNKNMLLVLDRELGADFDPNDFSYVTRWNPDRECVEMGLRADRQLRVHVARLGMVVDFAAGEELHNEVSCKFRKEGFTAELENAGLGLLAWREDPQRRYAVALAGPRRLA